MMGYMNGDMSQKITIFNNYTFVKCEKNHQTVAAWAKGGNMCRQDEGKMLKNY